MFNPSSTRMILFFKLYFNSCQHLKEYLTFVGLPFHLALLLHCALKKTSSYITTGVSMVIKLDLNVFFHHHIDSGCPDWAWCLAAPVALGEQ